jgi:CheY-like chemotaxis protein
MLILLVDDDHAFRSAVSKILQKEGFKVIEAGNGIEAYNIVSAVGANIDLLLTDLAMPRMDGLELAQLVADLYPDMPVMFMTDGVLTAQRLRSGYVVLHKPIRWRILAEAIRDSIGSPTVAAEEVAPDSPTQEISRPLELELEGPLPSGIVSNHQHQLEGQKRKVEIFSAGCSCCEDMIRSMKAAAASFSCEITVLDMRQSDVAQRAKQLGVRFVPAVVINGELVEHFKGRADLVPLRAARVGVPAS